MIRIYTIRRVLSMGDTMGCGVVSIRVNRHFSRHRKLGPQEGRELGLVYTIQKAPADDGTLRRGKTSDERKGRPCWRFHCPAWWSNSQENMQINYLQRLTRKLRLVRSRGRRGLIQFLRETCTGPWLDATRIQLLLASPCQLRLE